MCPSNRSLGQHVRNKHAAETSRDRPAAAAAAPPSRSWTPAEHALFLDALKSTACLQTWSLPRQWVPSQQSWLDGMLRRLFLRDHPRWLQDLALTSASPARPEAGSTSAEATGNSPVTVVDLSLTDHSSVSANLPLDFHSPA